MLHVVHLLLIRHHFLLPLLLRRHGCHCRERGEWGWRLERSGREEAGISFQKTKGAKKKNMLQDLNMRINDVLWGEMREAC
jgi:hypothetical protein